MIGKPTHAAGLLKGTRHETLGKYRERYYCPCGQEFPGLKEIHKHQRQGYKLAKNNCRLGSTPQPIQRGMPGY